jgi:hypothetical protein
MYAFVCSGGAELRDAGHEEKDRHEEARGGVEFRETVDLEMDG